MYTNGVDIDAVVPALQERIGWRQSTKKNAPVLNGFNSTSISGRYFNGLGFHALVTLENIKSAQEDEAISDDDFNQLLEDMQKDGIMRCVTEIFRDQPELIEQCLMYTRFATQDQIIENNNLVVGYIINIANDFGIATQINSCTLYFDADATFNLYLYQDGVKEPLRTLEVSVQAWQRTVVEFDELILNFKTGQKYYFCYYQNDLGGARAVQEQVERWATTLCFEAYTFTAPQTNDGFGFNHNYRQYNSLPQGLNLEIITFRDHTEKILRKANLFDEIQGLNMAVMVMELINNSTRSNFVERQTTQASSQTFMEINQAFATKEVPVSPGLKSRINAEFKRLKQTFFPPQKAMSMNMMPGKYGADAAWANQNIQQFKNPGVQKYP